MTIPVYFGSIVLEKNRWTGDKEPSYKVSDWLDRIRDAGFDGVELWENHWHRADAEEKAKLAARKDEITIFNSYCDFAEAGAQPCEAAREACLELACNGIKFNLGYDDERREDYYTNSKKWGELFPDDVRLLCECHPGTVIEAVDKIDEVFDFWDDPAFQAIVHPVGNHGHVAAVVDALGIERVSHAHVATFGQHENVSQALREGLSQLLNLSFAGTLTLEFTVGTRDPDLGIDMLFENACRDLAVIQEVLGRQA